MNTGYVYLSLTYFYFVMAVLVTPWAKEKRSRQLVCLPVSIRRIRGVHGLLHLIYWISIVMLFFVWVRISKYFVWDHSAVLALGVMTGISCCAYSTVAFASRFRDSIVGGVIQITLILFLGTIAVAGIVHNYQGKGDFRSIDDFLSWIFQSPIAALIWMIGGIGAAVSVLSLPRLKSYVE